MKREQWVLRAESAKMLCAGVMFLLSISGSLALWSPEKNLFIPHVEVYWESWEDSRANYMSNMSNIPITPLGSSHGVNVVNVAFADNAKQETCGTECITSGLNMNPDHFEAGVKEIHAKGGLVKLALGGETYGNPGKGLSLAEVPYLTQRIQRVVEKYDLDGVDIVHVRWDGPYNSQLQIDRETLVIRSLRELLPSKLISFTYPGYPTYVPTNADEIIENTHIYLDYITPHGANLEGILALKDLGVPKEKIVWGIWNVQDCYLEKLVESTKFVRSELYGGVSSWSINSDTAQRNNYPYGECNEYQTGHEDGTYFNNIAFLLNG